MDIALIQALPQFLIQLSLMFCRISNVAYQDKSKNHMMKSKSNFIYFTQILLFIQIFCSLLISCFDLSEFGFDQNEVWYFVLKIFGFVYES